MVESGFPRAVVLDLLLDGVTAPETVLAIKRISPSVALILCSGHPTALDDTMSSMPPRLIQGSLHKPFSPDALLNMLDEVFVG
jgi:DNA-binding NtrC family response regulator